MVVKSSMNVADLGHEATWNMHAFSPCILSASEGHLMIPPTLLLLVQIHWTHDQGILPFRAEICSPKRSVAGNIFIAVVPRISFDTCLALTPECRCENCMIGLSTQGRFGRGTAFWVGMGRHKRTQKCRGERDCVGYCER